MALSSTLLGLLLFLNGVFNTKGSDLSTAIQESEILRKKPQPWPSSNRGDDHSGRGLAGVMDEEMGFVD